MLLDTSREVDTFRHDGSCVCLICGASYDVETDAFGDGCMTYWFQLMLERREGQE